MSKYSSVFKPFDIRSIFNDPLDLDFTYSLAKALWRNFVKKYGSDSEFLLWCDWREGNYALMIAFIAWLQDWWCDSWVLVNTLAESFDDQEHPLGVCSTSFFYRCMYKNYHMWAILTASHNPPERVGMKVANINAALIPSHELEAMVDEYEEFPYSDDEAYIDAIETVIEQSLLSPNSKIYEQRSGYIDLLAEYFDSDKPITIVVDYSGGAACGYEQAFFEILQEQWNIEIIPINNSIDSFFTAHLSDTNQAINYVQLGEAVVAHKADFWVMFDGDWDRLGIVDENGVMVQGDMIIPVIATSVLHDNPWARIIYDITCSNNVVESIKKAGWEPIPSKVWYKNVKKVMMDEQAVFWWELSGHLLFPETWYAESPLLALWHILSVLPYHKTFSSMIATYTHRIKKPVTNYAVDDKASVLQAIKEQYADYALNELDWIRIDSDNWWLLVRPSSTEPKLRTYIEARDPAQIETLTAELEKIIWSKPLNH